MSYTGEDGRDVHFRLMDQVKPQWRRLAIALKFPNHEIATMEHKDDPVYYLLSEWLRGATKEEDPRPVKWRTLIESLQHANLQEEAAVLDEQCIISKEASQSGELHVHLYATFHYNNIVSATHGSTLLCFLQCIMLQDIRLSPSLQSKGLGGKRVAVKTAT